MPSPVSDDQRPSPVSPSLLPAGVDIAKLEAAGLWPITLTPAYCRAVARGAPDYLVRAVLLLAADQLGGSVAFHA